MRSTFFVVSRRATITVSAAFIAALMFMTSIPAHAAVVSTIDLATAANFTVLASSTVTNTGNSTLDSSLGLSPGTSITGFPPGQVNAPGTTHIANGPAGQGQIDLNAAYTDAFTRPVTGTVAANLGNQSLQAGVYSTSGHGALLLTGTLTLDGAGDPDSVFIIQTNSSLTTATSSSVVLLNGAKQCNVFWQIGSSATLGENSTFVGTIMASDSVTVNDSVTVRGRALALNGAVTLINDTFTQPSCVASTATTTTTTTSTTAPATTSTTTASGSSGNESGTDDVTSSKGSSSSGITGTASGSSIGLTEIASPPRTGVAPWTQHTTPWLIIIMSAAATGAITLLRRHSYVR